MRGWERCSQSLGMGGVAGFRCVVGGGREVSLSAYLAALNRGMGSDERRIHHHHHHHEV